MVAGNDQENSARARDRDALTRADHLSRRFGRRQSALSGRSIPGTVRRVAHLLLQLDHAPLSEGAADFRGDGAVHRGWRLSPRVVGHHHHGRWHVVQGFGRREPREGRHGPDNR